MYSIERINNFVRDFFDIYHINSFDFFHTYGDEIGTYVKTLLFSDGTIDDKTLDRISDKTGLSHEEILGADKRALFKYYDKFHFFSFWNTYYETINSPFVVNHDAKDTSNCVYDYYNSSHDVSDTSSCSVQMIERKIASKLKEIDKTIPGAFHCGCRIKCLHYETETIVSFPDCQKLLISFFEMVDRYHDLFFKLIDADLTYDEQLEISFLGSFLDVRDLVFQSDQLTYSKLRQYIRLYKANGSRDLLDFAVIKGFVTTSPWRCREFFENIDLVQRFVDIFPETKGLMREFALKVENYLCWFVWHDPTGDIKQAPKKIYIQKNRDELSGMEESLTKLRTAVLPAFRGGLHVRNINRAHIGSLKYLKLYADRMTIGLDGE